MAARKNGKLTKWVYNLKDKNSLHNETNVKYYKGLGSWTIAELKQVTKKDGLSKMIDIIEYSEESDEILDSWLNSLRPDDRKEFLRNNSFDIVKA